MAHFTQLLALVVSMYWQEASVPYFLGTSVEYSQHGIWLLLEEVVKEKEKKMERQIDTKIEPYDLVFTVPYHCHF